MEFCGREIAEFFLFVEQHICTKVEDPERSRRGQSVPEKITESSRRRTLRAKGLFFDSYSSSASSARAKMSSVSAMLGTRTPNTGLVKGRRCRRSCGSRLVDFRNIFGPRLATPEAMILHVSQKNLFLLRFGPKHFTHVPLHRRQIVMFFIVRMPCESGRIPRLLLTDGTRCSEFCHCSLHM